MLLFSSDWIFNEQKSINSSLNQPLIFLQIDPGWWQGLGPDGNYGLFPANYVEIIDASEIEQQHH